MPAFEVMQKGYRAMWDRAEITPSKLAMAHAAAAKILAHRSIYEDIEASTGIKWFAIGAIHYRESNCDFNTYLGNGQPLNQATTTIPKNRGPFPDFKTGAADAFAYQRFKPADTIERLLFETEGLNGWGYTYHDENSPYIWAGTTLEQPGMFDRDGHYVATLRDPRCGVVAIIKAIAEADTDVATFCKDGSMATAAPWPPRQSIPTTSMPQSEITIMNIFNFITALPALVADIQKFLPVFTAAMQAVQTLAKDMGLGPAVQATADHLTPGKPNAPQLNG